ncbi:hypothetical protein BDY24DRAFT_377842 [Mrakia frigida]|uniref:PCI domain-containing protein n=1 Tax=Mrakia frigida TaxID=29902 RepID=UPI003FCC1931
MSLSSIPSLPQKDRLPAYLGLLPSAFKTPIPSLVNVVDHILHDSSVTLVVGRQVYAEIVSALQDGRVGEKEGQGKREVLEGVLEKTTGRGGSEANYEEQTTQLRKQLADILEAEEDWLEAAKVLITIPLDSAGNSKFTDMDKLEHLIRIVRLLLEIQDDGQAQTYFNRASVYIHDCKDPGLLMMYKLSQARLNDFGRKFNEAALRYYELSWMPNLAEEERVQALTASVTCSILAPAGPARSRILSSLYRDDRTPSLPTYTILSKMFLENIIRRSEVEEFEKTLQSHQLARLASVKNEVRVEVDEEGEEIVEQEEEEEGGKRSERLGPETVLDRAVMEHNLLSCSKLYVNISFSGLGALLDLAPVGAESMARKMIEQERLRGWIDQIDKLIWFEGRDISSEGQGQATAGGLGAHTGEKKPLDFQGVSLTERWDENIGKVAEKVEMIANLIKQRGLLQPIGGESAAVPMVV